MAALKYFGLVAILVGLAPRPLWAEGPNVRSRDLSLGPSVRLFLVGGGGDQRRVDRAIEAFENFLNRGEFSGPTNLNVSIANINFESGQFVPVFQTQTAEGEFRVAPDFLQDDLWLDILSRHGTGPFLPARRVVIQGDAKGDVIPVADQFEPLVNLACAHPEIVVGNGIPAGVMVPGAGMGGGVKPGNPVSTSAPEYLKNKKEWDLLLKYLESSDPKLAARIEKSLRMSKVITVPLPRLPLMPQFDFSSTKTCANGKGSIWLAKEKTGDPTEYIFLRGVFEGLIPAEDTGRSERAAVATAIVYEYRTKLKKDKIPAAALEWLNQQFPTE